MKRDMDLVRELLLKIEAHDNPSFGDLLDEEADEEKLAEHIRLLEAAGFVTGIAGHSLNRSYWMDLRLTWEGHDFLDSVRDPQIWEKTKKGAEAAKGFTVELLKDLAKGFVKKQLEEYTGVKLA